MHVAIVTTYPPGQGTLNEYAFHFVRALRTKEEISRITLLVDALPEDAAYPVPAAETGLAAAGDRAVLAVQQCAQRLADS
jgi:hypothetical protein